MRYYEDFRSVPKPNIDPMENIGLDQFIQFIESFCPTARYKVGWMPEILYNKKVYTFRVYVEDPPFLPVGEMLRVPSDVYSTLSVNIFESAIYDKVINRIATRRL